MKEEFSRTAMLFGEERLDKLNRSKVIVFGAGGVGSYAIEALARVGIGTIGVVDADVVSRSNLNRQLIALQSTIGQKKVDVVKSRLEDISCDIEVNTFDLFYDQSTQGEIDLTRYDYVVDAIDSMESKILLIHNAFLSKVPIISALSTGNKIRTSSFVVSDIYKTSVCPIAKILRTRLKKIGVDRLKVVYSTEAPISPDRSFVSDSGKKTVGSISYVPSRVGLMLAEEVILDLSGI